MVAYIVHWERKAGLTAQDFVEAANHMEVRKIFAMRRPAKKIVWIEADENPGWAKKPGKRKRRK